jgi:hypothetical protein
VSFALWVGLWVSGLAGAFRPSVAASTIPLHPTAWPTWLIVVLILAGAATLILSDLALHQNPALIAGIAGPAIWLVALLATFAWRPKAFGSSTVDYFASPAWPTWLVLILAVGLVAAGTASWSAFCRRSRTVNLYRPPRLVVLTFFASVTMWAALLVATAAGAFGQMTSGSGFHTPGGMDTYVARPWWPTWALGLLVAGGLVVALLTRPAARERSGPVIGAAAPVLWLAAATAALLWRHAAYTYSGQNPGGCVGGSGPNAANCGLPTTPATYTYAWWPWWVDVGMALGLFVAIGLSWCAWQHRRADGQVSENG